MQLKPSDFLAWAGFVLGGLIAMKKPKKFIGWFLIVASLGYLIFVMFSSDNKPKPVVNPVVAATFDNNSAAVIQSAITTGSNSPIIQAASGATVNATINYGISEETMRKLLIDEDNNSRTELAKRFPHGYVLLGLVNGKLIFEPNDDAIKVNADWEHTTLSINHSNQTATYFFPHIIIGNFEMTNCYATFPYIGNKLTAVSLGPTSIWCEVLDLDRGIFLIGFK